MEETSKLLTVTHARSPEELRMGWDEGKLTLKSFL